MGMWDIYEFMKENPGYHTTRQLYEKVGNDMTFPHFLRWVNSVRKLDNIEIIEKFDKNKKLNTHLRYVEKHGNKK